MRGRAEEALIPVSKANGLLSFLLVMTFKTPSLVAPGTTLFRVKGDS